jgi:hypothetical protein
LHPDSFRDNSRPDTSGELSQNDYYFIKTRSKITLTPLFVKAQIV